MHKSTEKYNDICALKHNMLHYVMGETEKGFEDNPTKVHVLKEYIEMIKCLAEAEKECQEADYYESVVEAMENSDMGGRMGYNPNRNRKGQYSDGRGRNRGSRTGDDRSSWGDNDSDSGSRMGYTPDIYSRMMMDDMDGDWDDDMEDDRRYGRSFNRFRKAKRFRGDIHGCHFGARCSEGDGPGYAAGAGAQIQHPRLRPDGTQHPDGFFHKQFGLRPRDEHRRIHLELPAEEFGISEHILYRFSLRKPLHVVRQHRKTGRGNLELRLDNMRIARDTQPFTAEQRHQTPRLGRRVQSFESRGRLPDEIRKQHYESSIIPLRNSVMSIPAAATILGTSEALVMPGMVLTSRK